MVLGSQWRLARVEDIAATSSESLASDGNADEDEGSQYELEPWSDFLKRATYVAEELASAAGIQEWLTTWRKKQWRWAQRVITDGCKKWSSTALQWCPQLHTSKSGCRAQARPKKRWTDDVQGYLSDLQITQPWQEIAHMKDIWADLEPGFLMWGVNLNRRSA